MWGKTKLEWVYSHALVCCLYLCCVFTQTFLRVLFSLMAILTIPHDIFQSTISKYFFFPNSNWAEFFHFHQRLNVKVCTKSVYLLSKLVHLTQVGLLKSKKRKLRLSNQSLTNLGGHSLRSRRHRHLTLSQTTIIEILYPLWLSATFMCSLFHCWEIRAFSLYVCLLRGSSFAKI